MFVLSLFTFVVLGAFSVQAKVVTSFTECKEFFYKDTEPSGMDQNAKRICQKLQYAGSYYATLYSVPHRIPLYSAYTFSKCLLDSGRTNNWHIEPQISTPTSKKDYMVPEKEVDVKTAEGIKQCQAMSSHYIDSGYDRGHLNPNSFHCSEGRKATFTLTNAVPMDACFNRVYWKNWESTLRSFLRAKLLSDLGMATVYIVTGAVPDRNVRIPQKEISEDPEKVTVPSHIWTAVCYKHFYSNDKSFSFGYIGKNQPAQPDISLMSVSKLNDQLSELYRQLSKSYQSIHIFVDDCFGDNNKLNPVYYKFKNLINLPVKGVQMSTDIQNTYLAVKKISSGSISEKIVKVKEMIVKLAFDNMNTYYPVIEDLKGFARKACLITFAKPLVRKHVHDDLRKRDVSVVSDAVECLLVPEKQRTAADGSPCSSITDSDDSCKCDAGGKTKPCCSSPCLYQDKPNSYRCYSGQNLIECSPRYSLITANGERCMDGHPCATYGNDYYWCKTKDGYLYGYTWEYCSPPLWRSKAKNGKYCRSNHACAKYGSNYRWCYTDDENNYDKCCISDDCYSTVTEKRCRPDHPCGYHGNNYLWCYTDYKNNYKYCCTECA